jgi:membrane-associated phospholipid phosphatase
VRWRIVPLGLVVLSLAGPGQARADDPVEPAGDSSGGAAAERPGWTLFFEPDALVFMWGSAAVAATARFALEPPDDPVGFSAGEGGEPARVDTIPNWQLGVGAAVAPLLVGLSGTPARWYHAKGLSQSLLTTAAITEVTKNLVGRHRPSYDPATAVEDDRKSFFSGHASLTWSVTVYAGFYLHDHVFADLRGDTAFAWWELGPYLALGALSAWVPYTRIDDNKHHLSDIATGAAVGATMSVLFYRWQQHRFRGERAGNLVVTPLGDRPGLAVAGSF